MMQKVFSSLLAVIAFYTVQAQADNSLIYLQFPVVPPFTINKIPDSSFFTKADLRKKKATLIILFSPDCEHCQLETKLLKDSMQVLKNVQIVMVSFLDFNLIKKFYEDFQLRNYPNITMGRDGKYFLGTFYKLHTYPSMFLYNKKGALIKEFIGNIPIHTIAENL